MAERLVPYAMAACQCAAFFNPFFFTRCGDIAGAPNGEREREVDCALGSGSMRLIGYLPCLVR